MELESTFYAYAKGVMAQNGLSINIYNGDQDRNHLRSEGPSKVSFSSKNTNYMLSEKHGFGDCNQSKACRNFECVCVRKLLPVRMSELLSKIRKASLTSRLPCKTIYRTNFYRNRLQTGLLLVQMWLDLTKSKSKWCISSPKKEEFESLKVHVPGNSVCKDAEHQICEECTKKNAWYLVFWTFCQFA